VNQFKVSWWRIEEIILLIHKSGVVSLISVSFLIIVAIPRPAAVHCAKFVVVLGITD
jgi:hypothetical protein